MILFIETLEPQAIYLFQPTEGTGSDSNNNTITKNNHNNDKKAGEEIKLPVAVAIE